MLQQFHYIYDSCFRIADPDNFTELTVNLEKMYPKKQLAT